jgi:soluble lytic murein transglycosylase
MLLAVARQESNFSTDARSHAGAIGLMQLMPNTARLVARVIKTRYSPRRLTSDLDYNLRLGHAYLSMLLERYDGSYVLAIAGYNAGPASVNRWLRQNGDPRGGDIDPIDWIELIPYSETRNYVQRVMENLQIYRQRLATTRPIEANDRKPDR